MTASTSNQLTFGERLKVARNRAGLTVREAANSVSKRRPVTHMTISNWERDLGRPDPEMLGILSHVYEVTMNELMTSGPGLRGLRYRHLKSKVSARQKAQFEGEALAALLAFIRAEHLVKDSGYSIWQGNQLSLSDFAGSNPEKVAKTLREHLQLNDDQPVPSVVSVLERFNVLVIEIPTEIDVDGFAGWLGDRAVVALNPHVTADRARMDAAHELGHLLLGHCNGLESFGGTENQEGDAYSFASYFLLPQTTLKRAFEGKSVVRLLEYKEMFGISMAAMVYRAGECGIIKQQHVEWLWKQFSMRGWRKRGGEPGRVRPDRAARFETLVDLLLSKYDNSWSLVAQAIGLREEQLRQRWRDLMDVPSEDSEEGGNRRQTWKMRIAR